MLSSLLMGRVMPQVSWSDVARWLSMAIWHGSGRQNEPVNW
jgi:hypothetical protein